jgi:outer membrane phospholipase A
MPKLLSQIARKRFAFAMFCPLLCITFLVSADQTQVQQPSLSRCLQNAALVANDDATVGALRAKCERYMSNQVLERFEVEKLLEHNAFVITPHRQNYMLFATYNDKPNQSPFVAQNSFPEQTKPIQHQEAKFQTSFKVPLTRESLMFEGDGLYFAFTVKFFWQVYNKKISLQYSAQKPCSPPSGLGCLQLDFRCSLTMRWRPFPSILTCQLRHSKESLPAKMR